MSVSLTELTQETLRLLAEATNTPVGELANGSGGVTLTAEAAVETYLYQGTQRLARTCLPIRAVTGTIVVTAMTRELFLRDYTATHQPSGGTGYALFEATDIVGASRLKETREDILRAQDPDYQVAAGATGYWYRSGDGGIGLYLVPSADSSILVYGLALPPVPEGADAVPYLEDDLARFLLPRYAATMLGKVEQEDERLARKALTWEAEWDAERLRLWERIPPDLRRFFPPLSSQMGRRG